jgi:hypothetical protein
MLFAFLIRHLFEVTDGAADNLRQAPGPSGGGADGSNIRRMISYATYNILSDEFPYDLVSSTAYCTYCNDETLATYAWPGHVRDSLD